jgi:MFS family permease
MISVNYKTYVKAEILNDEYLTLIGSFGAIACSLSRILWGSILDKQTFKAIYYCLSILNAVLAFSVSYISSIKEIYFLYVVLSYICYGGHLGIFPAVTSQIFGVRYGPQIYGILFYAFPVSNFIQFLIVNYIDRGYEVIFQVSGVMSICALFIVKRIELNYDWSARIREHNERKRMLAR